MKVIVTGSLGLVGSEASQFYLDRYAAVFGIDNDMRRHFFGKNGSVAGNMITHSNYRHYGVDISKADRIFEEVVPDVIVHAAAQPSHDWAATNPILDFGINAYGTLMLLEMARKYCPEAVFIYVSTNKVYGDWPNMMEFVEHDKRYEPKHFLKGVNESMPIDQCMHSLFGVSKLAGDLLAQEYGKYFGMKTGVFRCGCITGPQHAGVEQHGFLSYLIKCKKEKVPYKVYGYKGKQVRDNIHVYDLITAIDSFVKNPRGGEVYNMGGGRNSNISVLEAIDKIGLKDYEYVDQPRKGDHQWYISDVSKFVNHYPDWGYKYDMEHIVEILISA